VCFNCSLIFVSKVGVYPDGALEVWFLVERLFIEVAFHQSGFSSKWLFIEAAFHQNGFSSNVH
jgi:hypothetical protein